MLHFHVRGVDTGKRGDAFNPFLWGVHIDRWSVGKVYVTRKMTADFFQVDIRTISRYIEQNTEELVQNGNTVLKGKKLKAF